MPAYLKISDGPDARKVDLTGAPVVIGRATGSDLPVTGESRASRKHCMLEPARHGDGYLIQDLKSTNGTRVNGQRVEKAMLYDGDRVEIGDTVIEYVNPDTPRPQAPKKPKKKVRAAKPRGGQVPAGALVDDNDPLPPNPLAGADNFELPPDESEASMFEPKSVGQGDNPLAAIHKLLQYGEADSEKRISLLNARGEMVHDAPPVKDEDKEAADEDETPGGETLRLFRLLLGAGAAARASDVHFEPRDGDGQIRMRLDGTMVEIMRVDMGLFKRMMNLVKILCDIDITQRAIVQEGHFSAKTQNHKIDYRISFTPSVSGQKLVIRILDSTNAPQQIDGLQMPNWMTAELKTVSAQTAGMLLVCGPTGSGKTTTLYACLRDIDRERRNVITIEDPVEYQIGGVTHIPVTQDPDGSFHSLLRSVLRQDPDVILLGEVRDAETAQTALQAAMTGHLVLSTVHSKDTIGTIFRLLDLGVEPYLLGSSLNLVLAQRLYRVLCENCKAPRRPQPTHYGKMGRAGRDVKAIYYPVGCPQCLNVGYKGRSGLFELLTVNDALRDAILSNPTLAVIRDALRQSNFISLQQAGWDKVAAGVCDVDEIESIVGK